LGFLLLALETALCSPAQAPSRTCRLFTFADGLSIRDDQCGRHRQRQLHCLCLGTLQRLPGSQLHPVSCGIRVPHPRHRPFDLPSRKVQLGAVHPVSAVQQWAVRRDPGSDQRVVYGTVLRGVRVWGGVHLWQQLRVHVPRWNLQRRRQQQLSGLPRWPVQRIWRGGVCPLPSGVLLPICLHNPTERQRVYRGEVQYGRCYWVQQLRHWVLREPAWHECVDV
jgi:hypothetical protein